MDLSLVQDVFHKHRWNAANAGRVSHRYHQLGNLLNHDWGVSQRLVVPVTAGEMAPSF